MKIFNTEPVVFFNAIGVLIMAFISFGVSIGFLPIDKETYDSAKLAIDAVIVLLINLFVVRNKVTPVQKL